MKIRVKWQIEDGYAGKSRPQEFIFDTNDYIDTTEWDSLTEEEKNNIIDHAVQEDFHNKVTYCIINYAEED